MRTKLSILLLIIILFSSFYSVSSSEGDSVIVVDINGSITHATVELVRESFNYAQKEQAETIILLLDTPGGGLQETFKITDMIDNSSIPIIGFVYPQGSAAWSAGTFILMSTHVAAMANYTVIGSCQPVEISAEGTKPVEEDKQINALVSWLQSKAEMHNRNKTIAEQFIRENLNLNASNALQHGAIEFIAPSPRQLLIDINGTNITTSTGKLILSTKNTEIMRYSPSLRTQFLNVISNPIVTSLLFLLGVFALIFGISTPGLGAEVFGVIAILLSFFGYGFNLPVLSIIFIIIGGILLLIEVLVIPGFGVAGIGGIICMVVGSIFLVPNYSTMKWVITMDWINDLIMVVVFAAVLIAAFFAFLLYKIIRIRSKKKAVGIFAGEKAIAIDKITPEVPGYVRFRGEYWRAQSESTIDADTEVIIIRREGSTLVVRPKEKEVSSET